MSHFKEKLVNIKAFAFDVDGVFSDQLFLFADGDLLRTMNVKDGYAVKYAVDLGYKIAIISGGKSPSLIKRFNGLGVYDVYLGSEDKTVDFTDFINKHHIDPKTVLYMGDDIPDMAVMQMVGLATCPSDAASEVKAIADYISDCTGGHGCVRDVVQQVLRVQGRWPAPNNNPQ